MFGGWHPHIVYLYTVSQSVSWRSHAHTHTHTHNIQVLEWWPTWLFVIQMKTVHTLSSSFSDSLSSQSSSHTHTYTCWHTHTAAPALIALFSAFFILLSLTIPFLCFSFCIFSPCIHLGATFSLVCVCLCDFFRCVCELGMCVCVCALHRKIYNAIEYANIAYLSCRQIHSLSLSFSRFLGSRNAYAYICMPGVCGCVWLCACLLLLEALHCDCRNFPN